MTSLSLTPSYQLSSFPTSVNIGHDIPTESELQDSWVSPDLTPRNNRDPYLNARDIISRETSFEVPGTTESERNNAVRRYDHLSGAVTSKSKKRFKFQKFNPNLDYKERRKERNIQQKKERLYDTQGETLLEEANIRSNLIHPQRKFVGQIQLNTNHDPTNTPTSSLNVAIQLGTLFLGLFLLYVVWRYVGRERG